MIERRRAASAMPFSWKSPSLTAPRSAVAMPQIPHMAAQSVSNEWTSPGGRAAARDLGDGGEEDADVEADRAVGDVLHVVDELVRPRLLAGHPRLGEAGDSGADDEPLPILRDLL